MGAALAGVNRLVESEGEAAPKFAFRTVDVIR